jgi:hypothetical protein
MQLARLQILDFRLPIEDKSTICNSSHSRAGGTGVGGVGSLRVEVIKAQDSSLGEAE